jgi:hypothetical protein
MTSGTLGPSSIVQYNYPYSPEFPTSPQFSIARTLTPVADVLRTHNFVLTIGPDFFAVLLKMPGSALGKAPTMGAGTALKGGALTLI